MERPPNLSRSPEKTEGMVLFKARMILEGRYQEYKALVKQVMASKEEENWNAGEIAAARKLGYEGFDREHELALGQRKAQPGELEPVKPDAAADLSEFYIKYRRAGLQPEDFVRPGAFFWYEQYYDPKLREKVVTAIVNNMVAPIAKAKPVQEAESEVERRVDDQAQMDELLSFIKERKG
jgi:hypothetical protein